MADELNDKTGDRNEVEEEEEDNNDKKDSEQEHEEHTETDCPAWNQQRKGHESRKHNGTKNSTSMVSVLVESWQGTEENTPERSPAVSQHQTSTDNTAKGS